MVIGILEIELSIPLNSNLKDKRSVLQSLKKQLQNKFNVSVAEIGEQEKWQRAVLAAVTVGTDKSDINSSLSKILNFIENYKCVDLINHEIELI